MKREGAKKGAQKAETDCASCTNNGRRNVLRMLAAVPLAGLAACGLFAEREAAVGTLAQLAAEGYLTGTLNGDGVHIRKIGDALVAFSLICTHKQCTVAWKPQDARFRCPCHKGEFDAAGNVLGGKPTEPLHRLVVEVREGDTIWVVNERVAR